MSVLGSVTLHQGLPAMPYFGGAAGYTYYDDIFLRFDITNILNNPWETGVLAEELFHAWQFDQGAQDWQFALYQQWHGHDQSPLEMPAINFGERIEACRRGGYC